MNFYSKDCMVFYFQVFFKNNMKLYFFKNSHPQREDIFMLGWVS